MSATGGVCLCAERTRPGGAALGCVLLHGHTGQHHDAVTTASTGAASPDDGDRAVYSDLSIAIAHLRETRETASKYRNTTPADYTWADTTTTTVTAAAMAERHRAQASRDDVCHPSTCQCRVCLADAFDQADAQ